MENIRRVAIAVVALLLATSHVQAKLYSIPAGDVTKLVEAINEANRSVEADTIVLATGVYRIDVPSEGRNGLPSIKSAIVLRGAGREQTEITNNEFRGRVLHVASSGSLTLERLTLSQGFSDEGGGAVISFGSLTVVDSKFSSSFTFTDGGAINNLGIATIRSSTIVGNGAFRGAGVANSGQITIIGTLFQSNRDYLPDLGSGAGGGVFNTGTAVIMESTFVSNGTHPATTSCCGRRGGAIFNDSGGLMLITNSSFTGNNDIDGGAIYNLGKLTLLGSTLTENLARNGGAILNAAESPTRVGEITIINSTISNNQAQTGAGILNQASSGVGAQAVVVNSTVVKNFGPFCCDVLDPVLPHLPGMGITSAAGASVKLQNSIVEDNLQYTLRDFDPEPHDPVIHNCGGTVTTLGHNLANDVSCALSPSLGDIVTSGPDALLGPLADNGGPTQTHALLSGSAAIDSGSTNGCTASDQRGALRPKPAGKCDIGAFEFGAETLANIRRSTAGDRDTMHSGDLIDHPLQSPRVKQLAKFIAADPGQGPGVDLDVGGANRPVGVTHYLGLPARARVTQAILKARTGSDDILVYNDGIYYDESKSVSEANLDCSKEPAGGPSCTSRAPILPVIVLRDLLGKLPAPGPIDVLVNLGKAPVRTVDTTGGPAGQWSSTPNEYRDLLGLLADGQWDMVFSDDLSVDWSELTLNYVMPGAKPGDLNGDGRVDRNDLNMLYAVLNTKAYGPDDPRDLDHDGLIRLTDVNLLIANCTVALPRCATQ